jgi:hypothetical protein
MSTSTSVQPQGACCACDQMWREYAHAIAEHLTTQMDLYMATAVRDWDTETELNGLLITRWASRDAARQIIRRHEQEAH